MKIGICQIKVLEGQIEKNIHYIENTIKSHIDKNLDLICFPELCISGYNFDIIKENFNEKVVFSSLAKKYNIKILAGIASYENNKYYDIACIWDENGELITEYKKIHLWGDEKGFFENGENISVININGYKVGIMICADLGFAEISKIMALNDCGIVICPAAWYSPYGELMKLLARARAAENQLYFVVVNRAEGDIALCGNSCVCDPSGNIIAESNKVGEDYLEVDIDITKVAEKRKEIPWLNMRLPHIYKKYQ